MNFIKNSHELGKIEVFFIIFILLAAVIAGVFAWKTGQAKQSDINSFAECVAAGNPVMQSYPEQCSANGKTFANESQSINDDDLPKTSDASEFKINEFGVEFDTVPGLGGLYYYIDPANSEYAYFSTEEFKNTDCAANQTSIAALSKLTDSEVNADGSLSAAGEDFKKIGDFYFVAEGAQAACSDDPQVMQKVLLIRESLIETINRSLKAS